MPIFLLLVVLFFVTDILSYQVSILIGAAFVFVAALSVVAIGIISLRVALIALVVALVLSDDVSRLDPISGRLTSVLTVSLGGVSIVNLVALALVGLGLFLWVLRASRAPRSVHWNRADWLIAGVLAVYALAAVHGARWWGQNPRGVINDLNLPIMLGGLYFLTRSTVRRRGHGVVLWSVLLAACAAKAVGWLLFFLAGIGFQYGSTLKVSNESGRVVLILVFVWGLIMQEAAFPARRRERLMGLVWAAAAGIGLLVQSQRGPWLMAGFAFLVLVAFGNLRAKARWALGGAGALIVVFAAVSYWMPTAFDTIRYHASTLRFWEREHLEQSQSTMIRIYEFKNIHALLKDKDDLILGAGPGSTFSDNYFPFPFGIFPSDYSWPEIERREFQNPHGLLQNLMLNLGYGGMAVYLAIIAGLYWLAFLIVRGASSSVHRAIALALLAFLPAMVYSSWSPKNNMILGILFGLLGCLWEWEMVKGREKHVKSKVVAASGEAAAV